MLEMRDVVKTFMIDLFNSSQVRLHPVFFICSSLYHQLDDAASAFMVFFVCSSIAKVCIFLRT